MSNLEQNTEIVQALQYACKEGTKAGLLCAINTIKELKEQNITDIDSVLKTLEQIYKTYANEPTRITGKVMITEEEILKDFEKLGYYLSSKKEGFLYNGIILSNKNIKGLEIHISFYMKSYAKYEQGLCTTITMHEHILLHELFECWGWL